MRIRWYGQSAFLLEDEQTVFIDPFGVAGDMLAARGLEFRYPAIEGVSADVLLITHEHFDHNAAEVIAGDPVTLRSTAGRLESPLGEVIAVASEHDASAGTERGPNTIFSFALGGLRLCHFGDFGQSSLREEQAAAIGAVDLLFVPVGAGPTIGAEEAAAIAARLEAHWIVPMHYRTSRVNFLEPIDPFLARMPEMQQLEQPSFDTAELPPGPLAVVPAAP